MSVLFTLKSGLNLILASGSPRRAKLLSWLGLPFTVCKSMAPEPTPTYGEQPVQFAQRCAWSKLQAFQIASPQTDLVLCADTIVCIDDEILGKPADSETALTMLAKLNGRQHQVITAVCLATPDHKPWFEHCISMVRFGSWPEEILKAYAATQEPLDKAGAYAVQGAGSFLIEKIAGSWTNVVGLPLDILTRYLVEQKLIFPA